MKIARQPPGFASTRLNGKMYPHTKPKNHPPADATSSGRVIDVMGDVVPAPSLRELSSECETEGVSSDGSTGLMVTRKPLLALKIFTGYVHRGTLPQSRPLGVPAPSEREPGWGAYHSSGYSLMSGVTGDFHRPYETLIFYIPPFIGAGGYLTGIAVQNVKFFKIWGWYVAFRWGCDKIIFRIRNRRECIV